MQDLKWSISVAVTTLLAFGDMLITAFRALADRISTGNRDIYLRIDEIKRDYVRRDDLDEDMKRIERTLDKLDDKMNQLLERPKSARPARRQT